MKPFSRARRVWANMKARCLNPNNPGFKYYGGRGIRVCPRWVDSSRAFIADMGEPVGALSLDRINNDGHYEPENCRWATSKEQANNRGGSDHVRPPIWSKKATAKFTISVPPLGKTVINNRILMQNLNTDIRKRHRELQATECPQVYPTLAVETGLSVATLYRIINEGDKQKETTE